MKLSVIVPVYNVEVYLEQCLNSCIHQDLPVSEYEIIVINDGSPDNSINIIRDFEIRCNNIVVVDKENGGLSSARNAGLSIARGEYIWFVDSDDRIEINILRKIFGYLSDKPEVLSFNLYYEKDNEVKLNSVTTNVENITGCDLFKKRFCYPYSAVQFYIFKRKFLEENQLSFCEGIVHEDWLFTPSVLSRAKVCKCVEDAFYYYRIRSGSITNSNYTLTKAENMLKVSALLYKQIKESRVEYEYVLYNSCARLIGQIYFIYCKLRNSDAEILRSLFFEKNYWIISIIKGRAYKYLLMLLLIRLKLKLGFLLNIK